MGAEGEGVNRFFTHRNRHGSGSKSWGWVTADPTGEVRPSLLIWVGRKGWSDRDWRTPASA